MFIIKKHYYLYIDSTKSIDLKLIKKNLYITIIYRNNSIIESIDTIIKFRKKLKTRKINFYIANNLRLAKICKADGLYISAYNKKFYKYIKVIGSAHNSREIYEKIKQGCKCIILSRLFKTNYVGKEDFYGPIKFNLITKKYNINFKRINDSGTDGEDYPEYPSEYNGVEIPVLLTSDMWCKPEDGYNFELHLNGTFLHYRAGTNWHTQTSWKNKEDPLKLKAQIFNQIIGDFINV